MCGTIVVVFSDMLRKIVLPRRAEFAAPKHTVILSVAYLVFAFDVPVEVRPKTKPFTTRRAFPWSGVCFQVLTMCWLSMPFMYMSKRVRLTCIPSRR